MEENETIIGDGKEIVKGCENCDFWIFWETKHWLNNEVESEKTDYGICMKNASVGFVNFSSGPRNNQMIHALVTYDKFFCPSWYLKK